MVFWWPAGDQLIKERLTSRGLIQRVRYEVRGWIHCSNPLGWESVACSITNRSCGKSSIESKVAESPDATCSTRPGSWTAPTPAARNCTTNEFACNSCFVMPRDYLGNGPEVITKKWCFYGLRRVNLERLAPGLIICTRLAAAHIQPPNQTVRVT